VPLYQARDAWEREYILGALGACEGNMSRAADTLGVERSNLYRKMRGLGIAPGRKEDADVDAEADGVRPGSDGGQTLI
jgi:DNA-binding NtrC family response regulator